MAFIKHSKREYYKVTEIKKITEILKKYVILNDLFLQLPFNNEPVKFLDFSNNNELLANFQREIKEDSIKIFAVYKNRYIGLILEEKEDIGGNYPENSYKFRVNHLLLGKEPRLVERIENVSSLKLGKVIVAKIRETREEVQKSISLQIMVKQNLEKFKNFDYKEFLFIGEKTNPLEVSYVEKINAQLYIKDLKNTESFFNTNRELFKKILDFDVELFKKRFLELSDKFRSILIRPIEYLSITGEQFTIGYVYLGLKEGSFDEDDLITLNDFAMELSEKVRIGNLVEVETTAKIINISTDGIMVSFDNKNLLDLMSKVDNVMMDIYFTGFGNIRVSGKIIYLYQLFNGHFYAGIDFNGSRYGPKFKKIVREYLNHLGSE